MADDDGNEAGGGRTRRRRSREEAENAIAPHRRRATARNRATPPKTAPERTSASSASPSSQKTASGKPESDPWTVPASVRDRFRQDGNRFYFPDGAPAFRDHGRRLTTPSENTELIASLIEIAQVRGWEEIRVSGTERFRQEAWQQARLAGLAVRGYRPGPGERANLARSRDRQEHERGEGETSANAPGVAEPGASRGRDELIVGKLLDHGREPYKFDRHREMSYFVRVETREGDRTIWGKDLSRALEEALTRPKIGDEVGLRAVGADPVTVKHRERDGEGQLLKETDLATHRNRWVIERREFFESRAQAAQVLRDTAIAPQVAVRSHPELAGTYLNLHAAEIAARRIRDPEDQKKFVSLVRGALADAIARGEPLTPVRLRERRAERARSERGPPVRG